MKNKVLNIIVVLFVFSFLILSFFQPIIVNAWSIDDIESEFKREEEYTTEETGMNQVRTSASKIISNIIAIIQIIGLGVAIIMLASLGIKYMTGSIEEKVQVKKHATVYVVGAIVFFAAAGILQILQEFIKANFKA